jgi:hypothetical protein
MEISSPSLPQAVAAARLALTEALVLKVGQTLEALVVGKTADGATQLKIGDQTVTAKLAQNFAIGTTLQLQVKSGGAAAHLAILSVRAPVAPPIAGGGAAVPPPAAQGTQSSTPFVTRQVTGEPTVVQARPAAPVPVVLRETSESARQVTVPSSQVGSRPATDRAVAPAAAGGRPAASAQPAPVPVASMSPPPEEAAVVLRADQPALPPAAGPTPTTPKTTSAPVLPSPVRAGPAVAVQETAAAEARLLPTMPAPAQVAVAPKPQPALQTAPAPPVVTAAPTAALEELPAATIQSAMPAKEARLAAAAQQPAMPAELEGEALNPLLLAQAAARPQTSLPAMPRVALPQSPLPPPPSGAPAPTALPQTPQAAVAHMVPEALARQDSIGPLLRTLAAVLQAPVALPEPIVRAALGLLAQRIAVPDGKVSANDLEQAVLRSGVGLEAALARGQPVPNDAKAGVMALRDMLAKWVGDGKPAAPPHDAAPPPLKGLPMRAPVAADAPALPDTARDIGKLLHTEADAAVSRIKLMQVASLPDGDPKLPAAPTLRVEVPFLVGHELVMAQIQIAREGRRREAEQRRGWTMRFALNFSATGEVGAEVGLLGKAVNVSLWAVEPKTAEVLAEGLPELQRALEAIGLDPGPIRMRHGPPDAERPASGHLLDSVS